MSGLAQMRFKKVFKAVYFIKDSILLLFTDFKTTLT